MSLLQQAIEQLSQNKIHAAPVSAPAAVRKYLQSNVLADAISVKASIHYTSLSGKKKQRDVIIRRLLKSGRHLFMEALCVAINQPRLIKVDQISRIEDSVSQRVYTDPFAFIEQCLKIELPPDIAGSDSQPLDDELFTAIRLARAEITALMFFSRADHDVADGEVDVVIDYVHQRCQHLTFKDEDLRKYLMALAPDPDSFNTAIRQIVKREDWILQMFIEHMIALITKDMKITPEESELAQQVISLAENEGYKIEYEKRAE